MAKVKQSWLLTGLLIVAVLGAGYFFGVKPQSAKANSVNEQTATQEAANIKLRGEIQVLQKQAAGVIGQQNRLRQIAAILPSSPALPRLIRSLTAITTSSGVDLQAMAPGAMTVLPEAAAAVVAPSAAPAAEPKAGDTAVTPVRKPASGLSAMPVTLTLVGNFTQLQLFVAKLEKLDRAFVVDTLAVTPATEATSGSSSGASSASSAKKSADNLTVSIVGRVFVNPAPVVAAPVKASAPAIAEK